MTGILRTSIPGFEKLAPDGLLAAAAKLGLGGLMVGTLLDVSPTLDGPALAAWRGEADRLGLRVATGMGWFNPALPARAAAVAALGGGDLYRGVARLIEAGADIGITEAFFTVGMIEDRFDEKTPWSVQLSAVADGLERLAPLLLRRKVRLLIKTHEEITTFEIARLIDRVGADILGVALDPVNVVVRLEDPVAAVRRIAPFVTQIHLDDAQVRFDGSGLRRYLCPFGKGAIDWPSIFALLPGVPRWIELHRGKFAMDAFDSAWLTHHPDLTVAEFAAVVGMAARVPAGSVIPVQDDPFARLPQLLGSGTSPRA